MNTERFDEKTRISLLFERDRPFLMQCSNVNRDYFRFFLTAVFNSADFSLHSANRRLCLRGYVARIL